MIELRNQRLHFRFPEVHNQAECVIHFQRTLRIPDDNREYPLPPGLGRFPLEHVDDYAERLPTSWREHGGIFLPMYQSEALWINFSGSYPCAIKVAAGKINAVTGEGWFNDLIEEPQDYVVHPGQPWLDGYCAAKGRVRQFVAAPLGDGFTAEEQLTGAAEVGGLQIVVYPMKAQAYAELCERLIRPERRATKRYCISGVSETLDMGLAPGGLMRQTIYSDDHGLEAWDQTSGSRCFVHLANSLSYQAITGKHPPTKPVLAAEYTAAGLPWFDYYAADLEALEGSAKLAGLDSVEALKIKKGQEPAEDNVPVTPKHVIGIRGNKSVVRETDF